VSTIAAVITFFTLCGNLVFVNVATTTGAYAIGTPSQLLNSEAAQKVFADMEGKDIQRILVKWDEVMGMQCG
jgi:hypothetical protein